jgi:hypothetical protein
MYNGNASLQGLIFLVADFQRDAALALGCGECCPVGALPTGLETTDY